MIKIRQIKQTWPMFNFMSPGNLTKLISLMANGARVRLSLRIIF